MKAVKNKVLTKTELAKFLKAVRGEGKKIVFTNGCFDILHAGHIASLRFAKSKGDILILGLNADNSVRKLKGEGRPINNEKDRAAVAAALEMVDAVVLFSEDTPYNLIKYIKPDILVKGADYKNKPVAGAQFARRLVLCPILKGRSTTNIIKKTAADCKHLSK